MTEKQMLGAGILLLIFIITAFQNAPIPSTIIAVLIVSWLIWKMISNGKADREYKERREKYTQDYLDSIRLIIRQHSDALGRKRRQLVIIDAYGNEIIDRWLAEQKHFVKHVLNPSIGQQSPELFQELLDVIYKDIDGAAIACSPINTRDVVVKCTKEIGDELEIHCEECLKAAGWKIRRIGGSGDQGIDLIAEKNSVRVVVQCKNYSNPVGNSAVQEIHTGKAFEEADHAVVITSSSYTSAAIQLAGKTGVILLHKTDISRFDCLVLLQQS